MKIFKRKFLAFSSMCLLMAAPAFADGGYGYGHHHGEGYNDGRGWHGGMFSSSSYSSSDFTSSRDNRGGVCCAVEAVQKEYIANAKDQLQEEASQGEGEHIFVLAQLFGCSDTEELQFAASLKKNYEFLFLDNQEEMLAQNIQQMITEEQGLSQCSLH